jgi:hypothetical protein
MLNISNKRLERSIPFFFVDRLFDNAVTDIQIFVYPLNSKAHREAIENLERKTESGDKLTDEYRTAYVAAYLFDKHENLLDDSKPLDVSDKEKLAELLLDESELLNQIIENATKKGNWLAKAR